MRLLIFCLPLLLSVPSQATTLVRFDLAQLVANAATVFVGTCVESDGVEIDGQVFTRVRFAVQQMVKGPPQAEITVHFRGGHSGDRHIHYAGMPRFALDEEVVLFLTAADDQGYAWPVGLAQGKFGIHRLAGAGKASIHQSLKGISFYGGAAKAAAVDGIELEDFLRQVRAHVNGAADAAR